MKNVLLPVAAVLAATLSGFAQNSKDHKPGDPFAGTSKSNTEDKTPKTYYSIINTNPEFKKTAVIIDPILVGIGGVGLASALRVESQFHKNVMVWAKASKTWIDGGAIIDDFTYAPVAVEGVKASLRTEAGGVFFAMNRTKDADVKVTTRIARGSRVDIHYYVKVPSKVTKMLGARAGYLSMRKPLDIDQDSRDMYYYKTADGSYQVPILDQYDPSIYPTPTPGIRQPAGAHEVVSGMSYTRSLFLGAHFRKVTNTIILLDNASRRKTTRVSDVYLDVLLPMSTSISNVKDIKGEEWQLAPNAGTVKNIGWRLGYAMRLPIGHFWQFNCEVGQRPGAMVNSPIGSTGTYFSLGIGGSIGFGKYNVAKKSADKKKSSAE